MSGALAVGGSGCVSSTTGSAGCDSTGEGGCAGASATGSTGFASAGGADCCASPHPTTSMAAIVVIRRCFICQRLSAFPTLAAVFAEEVGDFWMFVFGGPI